MVLLNSNQLLYTFYTLAPRLFDTTTDGPPLPIAFLFLDFLQFLKQLNLYSAHLFNPPPFFYYYGPIPITTQPHDTSTNPKPLTYNNHNTPSLHHPDNSRSPQSTQTYNYIRTMLSNLQ
eukprot:TRINITY_DN1932_c0_g1_i11.p1 TRINITY_DN1932_c0_g1~~TRINITY_DN1932_c0_g1_i11.p1  ORF type:complete len:119 (-),score=7.45 TRINITY_DN1932_c0_g1_i11:585-941(-)